MTDQPLISVILSIQNAADYLPECLDNLLQQTYKNIEIIAIDDFSSDDSFRILQNYAKKDTRLIISRNVKRYGTAMTLNRCMKRAQGQYIAFMNAKDISHTHRLQQQYIYLKENKHVVAIGVQCNLLTKENAKISISEFPTESLKIHQRPIDGISMLFDNLMVHRHRIPKDVLHFKTNTYPFIYTDIVMKLLKYGEVLNLPQVLYTKRIISPQQQKTRAHFPSLAKTWLRAITLYDHKLPLRSLFLNPLLASLK